MEYEDKENARGQRYVKGNFKLKTMKSATDVRRLLGFSKLYLKGQGTPRMRKAPDHGENPLTTWLKTRPSVGSVVAALLRTVMKN
jgi:hypothetical protein